MESLKLILILMFARTSYSFTCPNDSQIFYHADISTGCKVYHVCENSEMHTLSCSSGLAFNYKTAQCEEVSTVDCIETLHQHNHRKRNINEHNPEHFQQNNLIKNGNIYMSSITNGLNEILASNYLKFEEECHSNITSIGQNLKSSSFDEKVWPLLQTMLQHTCILEKLIDNSYLSSHLFNSPEVTSFSVADFLHENFLNLKPVIQLRKYVPALILQQSRKKRSADNVISEFILGLADPILEDFANTINSTFMHQGTSLSNEIILPIFHEMMKNSVTRSDLIEVFISCKTIFSSLLRQVISPRRFAPDDKSAASITRHLLHTTKFKYYTQIKPIMAKVFQRHQALILEYTSLHSELIINTIKSMNETDNLYTDVIKDILNEILTFLNKNGIVLQTSVESPSVVYNVDFISYLYLLLPPMILVFIFVIIKQCVEINDKMCAARNLKEYYKENLKRISLKAGIRLENKAENV